MIVSILAVEEIKRNRDRDELRILCYSKEEVFNPYYGVGSRYGYWGRRREDSSGKNSSSGKVEK